MPRYDASFGSGALVAIKKTKCRGLNAAESSDKQIGDHGSAFMNLIDYSSLLMGSVMDPTHREGETAAHVKNWTGVKSD